VGICTSWAIAKAEMARMIAMLRMAETRSDMYWDGGIMKVDKEVHVSD
jgi:hypothetical protein